MHCTCILNVSAFSQLCESCEAEYLQISAEAELQDKIQNTHGEDPEGGHPATLADIAALSDYATEQFAHSAHLAAKQDARITELENALLAVWTLLQLEQKEAA